MTIVEFLFARISEDEVAATAAGKLQFWRYDNEPLGWSLENDGGERILTVDPGTIAVGNYWNHAARHLPERVLAECAAKRGIVELHQPEDDMCGVCSHDIGYTSDGYGGEYYENQRTGNDWPCATLRALAAVYSDHPDYRQEWA